MEPQTNGQQSDKPPEIVEDEPVKIQGGGETPQEKVPPPPTPKLPPQPCLITPSLTLEEEAQQKLGKDVTLHTPYLFVCSFFVLNCGEIVLISFQNSYGKEFLTSSNPFFFFFYIWDMFCLNYWG